MFEIAFATCKGRARQHAILPLECADLSALWGQRDLSLCPGAFTARAIGETMSLGPRRRQVACVKAVTGHRTPKRALPGREEVW
jgi:hypothetical protein